MLNAVPSAPKKVSEQVAQFGYAERDLSVWSFSPRAHKMTRIACASIAKVM